jgi:hypothetical protein
LKEIGIHVVGDRLMFRHHLKELSRRDRFNKRMEALWHGVEQVFFSDHDRAFCVSTHFRSLVKHLVAIFTGKLTDSRLSLAYDTS